MANTKSPNRQTKRGLQTTADGELTRLRVLLNKKSEYIAILELELFNTRAAVLEFSAIYNERLAPLEKKLRELRRLLYEAVESHREPGEPEPEAFNEAEEEEEFTYQDGQENGNGWREISKQAKPKNPQMEEKIRVLFRKLAKRFHPDLTNDPDEKIWRAKIMTQVNQAYAQRDLAALQAIAEQPDRPFNPREQSREEEIAYLKAELKRLDGVIADLKGRINHLEESPAWQIKMEARMQRKDGKDLIAEKEKELQLQIDDLIERLKVLGVEMEEAQNIDASPRG